MGCLGKQPIGEPTRYSARRSMWWAAITIAHRNGMKVLQSEVIDVISRSSGSCTTMITAGGIESASRTSPRAFSCSRQRKESIEASAYTRSRVFE